MGTIRTEVRDKYLNHFPEEEILLKPFLSGFHVTWATRQKKYNTELSVYFLNPESHIKEGYGFENEIMLVYAPYKRMEPRTIQAIEQILTLSPAKGRVDTLTYFLISENSDVKEWLHSYLSARQESRLIIAFYSEDLKQNISDTWFVRNKLNEQFYGRDLFDYKLPLTDDTYFFGRQHLLANYIDAIKQAENRGVFGLRKTGKTSFLFKIQRLIRSQNLGQVFFYDCKSPSIRKLKWNDFLGVICDNISQRLNIRIHKLYDEINIVKTFKYVIRVASQKNIKIVLIFDEIEYISFKSLTNKHWENDFIDFWQTIWASQSLFKNLVCVIAGVNPSVAEIDTINGIQNPLFGIISYEFLKGFSYDELKVMVKTLGKKMGLQFDHESIQYLHKRYGGHPLLSRLACSWINKNASIKNESKPVIVDLTRVTDEQELRDSDLTFYCRHVVSELRDFYQDEYVMLEYLACGQTKDFLELSSQQDFIKHLISYGLLDYDNNKIPFIAIPVVGRYIGLELAREEGRQTIYRVIEKTKRHTWIEQRKDLIIKDFRILERLIKTNNLPLLFGCNSFPEADEFHKISIVESKNEFSNFINTCNRCFVESLENYGKSTGKSDYFWKDIKDNYPGLFYALDRIKTYRNEQDHLVLNNGVEKKLLDYLKSDLEGKKPSQIDDLYFILEQRVLDGILTGIQIELNNIN